MAYVDLQTLAIRENAQTEWKENVADLGEVLRTLAAFADDLSNLCGRRAIPDGDRHLPRWTLTPSRSSACFPRILVRVLPLSPKRTGGRHERHR